MSSKRFEGKNLEEAIDSAARSFGVESFRVSYHVVLEKRGFLGGTKRVVIEAEVSGAADRKQSTDRPAKPERSAKPDRPARSDRPAKSERSGKSKRPARDERAESAPEKGDSPKKEGRPPRRPRPDRQKEAPREAPQFVYDEEPRSGAAKGDAGEAPQEAPVEAGRSEGQDEGGRNGRRRGRRGRGGRGRGRGRGSESQSSETPSESALPEKREAAAMEPPAPVEIPEQGEQSADAALVVAWCDQIFRISGLDLVARTTDNEEEISVELFGRDVATVLESSDYLDSLQVLANKAFTGRSIERPIEFDAGGFKRRREEDLAQRARETADRVRDEGKERTMRAMSPIERRIVHLALEDDRSVTTESRGRGFHKRVVIQPVSEEQSSAEES